MRSLQNDRSAVIKPAESGDLRMNRLIDEGREAAEWWRNLRINQNYRKRSSWVGGEK